MSSSNGLCGRATSIEIDVHLKEQLANAFFLTAKITCEGKLAARFDFACALANAYRNDEG